MKVAEFLELTWTGGESPLIEPPRFSPVIADPSFLFPEETPSGEWILYAHSAWGVHEYTSIDGLSWKNQGIKAANAMRPCIRRLRDGSFALLYEKYRPLALPLQILPGRRRWASTIELRRSADLSRWSKPLTILEPSLAWMRDPGLGDAVSNPCLLETEGGMRLYFSASLSWIDDCGFCEPRFIGMAESTGIDERFTPLPLPVIDPAGDALPGVLGAGSLKALRLDDGWIGLQNKIYRDPEGSSRSAIFILRSKDGIAWESARSAPLVAPDSGWKKSHVYACDCRFSETDGRWYLYFNARDAWKLSEGRERIGRIASSKC